MVMVMVTLSRQSSRAQLGQLFYFNWPFTLGNRDIHQPFEMMFLSRKIILGNFFVNNHNTSSHILLWSRFKLKKVKSKKLDCP